MNERTRGAILLARVGQTQLELASRLGVSTGIVAMWLSGQRSPGLPNRRMMLEKLKIPIEAWDDVPETVIPVAARRPSEPAQPWGEAAASARIARLQRIVDAQLDRLECEDADMTPLEHAKVTTEVRRNLDGLRSLRGESLPEVKVLRLPAWVALRNRVVDALRPHPEALRAVVNSLDDDDEIQDKYRE